MEVLGYHGFSSSERKIMFSLIQNIPVIEMNSMIKDIAIKIVQNHRIKLPDSIIAATAIYLKSACITNDGGFKQIKDLDLIFYSS